MKLYLVRHAIAEDSAGYEDDSLRPLTEKGRERMKRIAAALMEIGVQPDLIVSSPYLRASQTASILAKALKYRDFINRELSLLEFQRRVLEEARTKQPAARAREIPRHLRLQHGRVLHGARLGLRKQVEAGVMEVSPDGMTPREQLAAIRKLYIELDRKPINASSANSCPNWKRPGSISSNTRN
jgi:broad specificity phosphatase PhoE